MVEGTIRLLKLEEKLSNKKAPPCEYIVSICLRIDINNVKEENSWDSNSKNEYSALTS